MSIKIGCKQQGIAKRIMSFSQPSNLRAYQMDRIIHTAVSNLRSLTGNYVPLIMTGAWNYTTTIYLI